MSSPSPERPPWKRWPIDLDAFKRIWTYPKVDTTLPSVDEGEGTGSMFSRPTFIDSRVLQHGHQQPGPCQQTLRQARIINRGLFTPQQKLLIRQYRHESAASVLERLRDQDPTTERTRLQVKGAVENQRRKQRRREQNGVWTGDELRLVGENLDKAPGELMRLLRRTVLGFRKNIDQVRDMKNTLVGRERERRLTGAETIAVEGGMTAMDETTAVDEAAAMDGMQRWSDVR